MGYIFTREKIYVGSHSRGLGELLVGTTSIRDYWC